MEQTNEPSPADGNRKIEQAVKVGLDKEYEDLLRRDQEANDAQVRGEAVQEFDKVRKLGFATRKDIEDMLKDSVDKYQSEVNALRDENTQLREWVMRAKAQGLAGGATDDKPKDENRLKAHERFRW